MPQSAGGEGSAAARKLSDAGRKYSVVQRVSTLFGHSKSGNSNGTEGGSDRSSAKLSMERETNKPKIKTAAPTKEARTLILQSVEVTRVREIREAEGTFEGQLHIELCFKGGALDKDLMAIHPKMTGHDNAMQTPYFPFEKDAEGRPTSKPTFKPNAAWYMSKIVIENMASSPMEQLKDRDAVVRVSGDDITLQLYMQGTFYEMFELDDFPFDSQDLTFSLTLNVQLGSPMSVQIRSPAAPKIPSSRASAARVSTARASFSVAAGAAADGEKNKGVGNIYKPGFFVQQNWKSATYLYEPYEGHPVRVVTASTSTGAVGEAVPDTMRDASEKGAGAPSAAGWRPKAKQKKKQQEAQQYNKVIVDAYNRDARKFPTANISVKVTRKPRFYIMNVMLPAATFGIFGLLQFSMDPNETTRHELAMSMVLTTFLFKVSALNPSLLPPVNYLTLLDRFVLYHTALVWLMAVENGVVAMWYRFANTRFEVDPWDCIFGGCRNDSYVLDGGDATTIRSEDDEIIAYRWIRAADGICMVFFFLAWAGHILYFVCFYRKSQRKNNTALEDFDYEQLVKETKQGSSYKIRKKRVHRYEEAYGGNVVLHDRNRMSETDLTSMRTKSTLSRWTSLAKMRGGGKRSSNISGRCFEGLPKDSVAAVSASSSAATLGSAQPYEDTDEESSRNVRR